MKIVRPGKKISRQELTELAAQQFGDLVKGVVDIERGTVAIGGELHADEEAALLEDGSQPANLWGINLYPGKSGDEWIEFDSVVNLKPAFGNRTRGVEDAKIRRKIEKIIQSLVE